MWLYLLSGGMIFLCAQWIHHGEVWSYHLPFVLVVLALSLSMTYILAVWIEKKYSLYYTQQTQKSGRLSPETLYYAVLLVLGLLSLRGSDWFLN